MIGTQCQRKHLRREGDMVVKKERTVFGYEHLSCQLALDLFLQVVIPAERAKRVEPESMRHSTGSLENDKASVLLQIH